MLIYQIPAGPFDTNAYVAACSKTKKAVIIDVPPDSLPEIIDCIESNNLIPEKILLTHSHWDHIADTKALKEKYNIPVFLHPADAPNLKNPGSDGIPLWITIPSLTPDEDLIEGKEIVVGESRFKVIETPGHSPGCICLYNPQEKILFSGDTLFHGSIGNLSFSTAHPDKMWLSLDKLAALPADTKVYPGHGPATTIGKEDWLPQARKIFGNL